MDHSEIVDGFLFPANEEPSCAIRPGVRPLDNPAAGLGSAALARRRGFAFGGDVNLIAPSSSGRSDSLGVVTFVGAKMLLLPTRRSRTPDGNAAERLGNELLVIRVGAGDRHAEGDAAAVDQHRSLDAQLAPIGRILAGFFPRPAATWSSPRPDSAIASSLKGEKNAILVRVLRASASGCTFRHYFGGWINECRLRARVWGRPSAPFLAEVDFTNAIYLANQSSTECMTSARSGYPTHGSVGSQVAIPMGGRYSPIHQAVASRDETAIRAD